jgi:hypothetical protein
MQAAGDTTGQPSGDAAVLDLEGREVSLGAVCQRGPVLLVWLRHYG